MCGVEARDEAAALQGAQLSWCSRSCADDIIEGEPQGCMVLVSSLMLGRLENTATNPLKTSHSDCTIDAILIH